MKYPSRNGLAIPVQELGFRVVNSERGKTSQHHLFFERRAYQTAPVRRIFRGLVSNVYTLPNQDHQMLHERFSAPILPSQVAMIDCIEEYISVHGVIDVVCERKTHETYQIEQDRWDLIIGRAVA